MEQAEQRMGNYRLIRLLGTGAFADVYLGEHLYLNTPVAIKVLRAPLDESTLDNFLTEARHLSQLVHPHIIRVFDFGLESNIPFLVMDYAPAGNLRGLHPSGTLVPLSTIVSYVKVLASALQHAHAQHLIHSDLKPENVLLGPNREVLLSDFGLARVTSEIESVKSQERFGTLAYMAPEVIHGQPCPASDQYALAVMIYEWLCGQRPFKGSADQLATQHLYADPSKLCARNPEVPVAVEQVVFTGLSKDPTQRFADMLSFALAFEEASLTVSPVYVLSSQSVAVPSTVGMYPSGLSMRLRNVPVPLTPLIGRQKELQAAHDLLLRPDVRLLTLAGSGGIGKTHLALTVANDVRKSFAQGVCFVSLETISDPQQVIPAILRSLGLPEQKDCNQLEQLQSFLGDRQLLVLLDNFEQVLPAAPLLSKLLSSCPKLKLLVTSRALLHVWGEYALMIPPLELPDQHHMSDLDALLQIASVTLFVQRAQAILPEFQLTMENARDIAEICRRLEGLPLALELSAACTKLLPPHMLLGRLEAGLQILSGGRVDAPVRQQTLRNTLSWTYDLLSADEQTLFRRLAVFVGGCTLQAAEAITATLGGTRIPVLEGVVSLIDKSLLHQPTHGEDEPRLYSFEMVREYGWEQLIACGELEQTRDAHAAYYLALAEEADAGIRHSNEGTWQEREHENLRESLQWLLEQSRLEEALRLAIALQQFWVTGGYMNEGRSFLERVLEVSRESRVPVSSEVKAKALRVADSLLSNHNDPEYTVEPVEVSKRSSRQLQQRQSIPTINIHNRDVLPARTTAPFFPAAREDLTAREIEVLRLLAMGMSNSQIAERLVLSPHTINVHNQSIFGKLGVNSRSGATRYALEHQLA